MRVLFFVVAALAALYGGYWFVGSWQVETRAQAALADLAAHGWEVDYADLSTRGFPSRFDTTVTDLRLASPDGRVEWETPFVQVFALAYRPNQVIAVWPPEQVVTVLGQPLTVTSEGLRASGTARLSTDLPLDHAALESGPLAVTSEQGWSLSLDRLLAAIREAGPATYDVYFEGANLGSPLTAAGLDVLRLDGQVALGAPLDRRLDDRPEVLALSLREARLGRGTVALRAQGDLVPDAEGFLAGDLRLSVENWRGLLDLLAEAGLLPFERRAFVEPALEQLAQGSDDLDIPLTFADGQVEALGLALFEAPRL
ncbi:DUF2125 domain-containing protein [Rubellimicrobium roseum]|uniref:DUF2125 domain-containing protein n=1 Tax=Rubellimicrobium roseum TaxID=687525 RepID=A0A5C4NIU4_9RHOB|nr:DUF2125 domain-containing protein [Rubellimicrobium roseum]TNC74701.1 DUF2125 domain-containing protein [Rubellimicrobium roseum]